MRIDVDQNEFCIDASLLGSLFKLPAQDIPALMRNREITSICERGVGEDDGRYRLNFFYGQRRVRLNVDAAGTVLQRSVVDFGDRASPQAMRR